jgi:hypothetical protein
LSWIIAADARSVIPAKAGIHGAGVSDERASWPPAFAGVTNTEADFAVIDTPFPDIEPGPGRAFSVLATNAVVFRAHRPAYCVVDTGDTKAPY